MIEIIDKTKTNGNENRPNTGTDDGNIRKTTEITSERQHKRHKNRMIPLKMAERTPGWMTGRTEGTSGQMTERI